MCGVAGYHSRVQAQLRPSVSVVEKMLAAIAHRGPDDAGTFDNDSCALGNARLSIVDVRNGRQPMILEQHGRRLVISYNGEIYNHAELRSELENAGWAFRTKCDTEVALVAFAAWGDECVRRFDGQFAFAIWDEKSDCLLLARDPAGIKPLFYHVSKGTLLFASEIKALFASGLVRKAPNQRAILEYLIHGYAFASGYVTGERTFFENVHALPPASIGWWNGSALEVRRYWSPPVTSQANKSAKATAAELRSIFERRMPSYVSFEVPTGVALSGGVDSSIIATMAARELAVDGRGLVASCISFAGRQENPDLQAAGLVADHIQSEGGNVTFTAAVLAPGDYLRDLDEMIRAFDEPHWEIKQLGMFRNYRNLREMGAKVVLAGEGADELFFGYYTKFPGFTNPRLESGAALKLRWSARSEQATSCLRNFSGNAGRQAATELMDEAIDRFYGSGADPEKRMQQWYFHTFLHWLLTVNDRCSMAFSLEGRFPFLDRDVIDLAFRTPAAFSIRDGSEKVVVREAFADLLPPAIANRRKSPLPSPVDVQFHLVVARAFAAETRDPASGVWAILDREILESLADDFLRRVNRIVLGGGDAGALSEYQYLSQPLELRTPHVFALLTVIRWYKINFEEA